MHISAPFLGAATKQQPRVLHYLSSPFFSLFPVLFLHFASCNSLLLTFSCWAFSFPCRFIKAACMNAARRRKAPADPLNISRQQLAREEELVHSSLASKLPWTCPANRDSPWHDLASKSSWRGTGPFAGWGFC